MRLFHPLTPGTNATFQAPSAIVNSNNNKNTAKEESLPSPSGFDADKLAHNVRSADVKDHQALNCLSLLIADQGDVLQERVLVLEKDGQVISAWDPLDTAKPAEFETLEVERQARAVRIQLEPAHYSTTTNGEKKSIDIKNGDSFFNMVLAAANGVDPAVISGEDVRVFREELAAHVLSPESRVAHMWAANFPSVDMDFSHKTAEGEASPALALALSSKLATWREYNEKGKNQIFDPSKLKELEDAVDQLPPDASEALRAIAEVSQILSAKRSEESWDALKGHEEITAALNAVMDALKVAAVGLKEAGENGKPETWEALETELIKQMKEKLTQDTVDTLRLVSKEGGASDPEEQKSFVKKVFDGESRQLEGAAIELSDAKIKERKAEVAADLKATSKAISEAAQSAMSAAKDFANLRVDMKSDNVPAQVVQLIYEAGDVLEKAAKELKDTQHAIVRPKTRWEKITELPGKFAEVVSSGLENLPEVVEAASSLSARGKLPDPAAKERSRQKERSDTLDELDKLPKGEKRKRLKELDNRETRTRLAKQVFAVPAHSILSVTGIAGETRRIMSKTEPEPELGFLEKFDMAMDNAARKFTWLGGKTSVALNRTGGGMKQKISPASADRVAMNAALSVAPMVMLGETQKLLTATLQLIVSADEAREASQSALTFQKPTSYVEEDRRRENKRAIAAALEKASSPEEKRKIEVLAALNAVVETERKGMTEEARNADKKVKDKSKAEAALKAAVNAVLEAAKNVEQKANPAALKAEMNEALNDVPEALRKEASEKLETFWAKLRPKVQALKVAVAAVADLKNAAANSDAGLKAVIAAAETTINQLSEVKGAIKLAATQVTGSPLHNYSHRGLLAKDIGQFIAAEKKAYSEAHPGKESEIDHAVEQMISKLQKDLSTEKDPHGVVLAKLIKLAVQDAKNNTMVWPASIEQIMEKNPDIEEYLKQWGAKQLSYAAALGSISAVAGFGAEAAERLVSITPRDYLPVVRSGLLKAAIAPITIGLGIRALKKATRVGENPEAAIHKYLKREVFKFTIRVGTSALPSAVRTAIAAGFAVYGLSDKEFREKYLKKAREEFAENLGYAFVDQFSLGWQRWRKEDTDHQPAAAVVDVANIVSTSADESYENDEFLTKLSAKDELSRMANESSDPMIRELAAHLMTQLDDDIPMWQSNHDRVAEYRLSDHSIRLGANAQEQTKMHEIVHSLTAQKLKVGLDKPESPHGQLAAEIDALRRKAQDAYEGSDPNTKDYLNNIDEFVAGLYSGKSDFIDHLSAMQIEGKSMLSEVVEIIRRVLGLAEERESVLTKAMGLTDNLINTPLDATDERIDGADLSTRQSPEHLDKVNRYGRGVNNGGTLQSFDDSYHQQSSSRQPRNSANQASSQNEPFNWDYTGGQSRPRTNLTPQGSSSQPRPSANQALSQNERFNWNNTGDQSRPPTNLTPQGSSSQPRASSQDNRFDSRTTRGRSRPPTNLILQGSNSQSPNSANQAQPQNPPFNSNNNNDRSRPPAYRAPPQDNRSGGSANRGQLRTSVESNQGNRGNQLGVSENQQMPIPDSTRVCVSDNADLGSTIRSNRPNNTSLQSSIPLFLQRKGEEIYRKHNISKPFDKNEKVTIEYRIWSDKPTDYLDAVARPQKTAAESAAFIVTGGDSRPAVIPGGVRRKEVPLGDILRGKLKAHIGMNTFSPKCVSSNLSDVVLQDFINSDVSKDYATLLRGLIFTPENKDKIKTGYVKKVNDSIIRHVDTLKARKFHDSDFQRYDPLKRLQDGKAHLQKLQLAGINYTFERALVYTDNEQGIHFLIIPDIPGYPGSGLTQAIEDPKNKFEIAHTSIHTRVALLEQAMYDKPVRDYLLKKIDINNPEFIRLYGQDYANAVRDERRWNIEMKRNKAGAPAFSQVAADAISTTPFGPAAQAARRFVDTVGDSKDKSMKSEIDNIEKKEEPWSKKIYLTVSSEKITSEDQIENYLTGLEENLNKKMDEATTSQSELSTLTILHTVEFTGGLVATGLYVGSIAATGGASTVLGAAGLGTMLVTTTGVELARGIIADSAEERQAAINRWVGTVTVETLGFVIGLRSPLPKQAQSNAIAKFVHEEWGRMVGTLGITYGGDIAGMITSQLEASGYPAPNGSFYESGLE